MVQVPALRRTEPLIGLDLPVLRRTPSALEDGGFGHWALLPPAVIPIQRPSSQLRPVGGIVPIAILVSLPRPASCRAEDLALDGGLKGSTASETRPSLRRLGLGSSPLLRLGLLSLRPRWVRTLRPLHASPRAEPPSRANGLYRLAAHLTAHLHRIVTPKRAGRYVPTSRVRGWGVPGWWYPSPSAVVWSGSVLLHRTEYPQGITSV